MKDAHEGVTSRVVPSLMQQFLIPGNRFVFENIVVLQFKKRCSKSWEVRGFPGGSPPAFAPF